MMNYFSQQDIEARRSRLAAVWNGILNNGEAVLIHSGSPIQKPGGLDQTYQFLPHPFYYWLTARRREDEVVLYSRDHGWIEFQKKYSKDVAVWEGDKNDLLLDVPGKNIDDLKGFLASAKFANVYDLGQSGRAVNDGKEFDLRTVADRVRRVKDAAEISLVRKVSDIAASGYAAIEHVLRAGITEKEVQVTYESEIARRGAHGVPYDSIVGSGKNAAVLHALPTMKIIGENELVLVDAGAEIFDYCVDITRTYNSSKRADTRQKSLYDLVLKVQKSCMAMSKPGVFWRDVHSHAATLFTEGLRDLGIFKGELSTLLEKQVISMFFPHGLGHLIGIRVRDVGHEENLHPRHYFGARLRVDIQLEKGHYITVEPGLYFIEALLNDADNITKFRDDINWQELEHWKNIGGVRIEDNILITESGNENLTANISKAERI